MELENEKRKAVRKLCKNYLRKTKKDLEKFKYKYFKIINKYEILEANYNLIYSEEAQKHIPNLY